MFPCVFGRRVASSLISAPAFRRGADSVGGQLCGDTERVPLQWRDKFWQSLEEGAGKRCSECDNDQVL